jgi:hypothetical protein
MVGSRLGLAVHSAPWPCTAQPNDAAVAAGRRFGRERQEHGRAVIGVGARCVLQLDTIWVALKAAAGPGTPSYDQLAVDQRMADDKDSDEAILAALVAAAETVCRVLPEVFAFELATHGVLVVDGAWLVPTFVAGLALDDTDVAAIYLQHTSPEGVTNALAPRLAGRNREARHVRMDRRI